MSTIQNAINGRGVYQAQPANPTNPTGTSPLMAGLKGAITPKATGNVMFILSGQISTTVATDTANCQLRYGTGTAPNNGAALTGTQVGNKITTAALASSVTTFANLPFSISGIITGATIGTALWLDAAVGSSNAGNTASISNLSISAFEI